MKEQLAIRWLCSGLAILVMTATAAENSGIQLKGILATSTARLALLELRSSRPPDSSVKMLLAERSRQDGVEVLKIDARAGAVEVSVTGGVVRLEFSRKDLPAGQAGPSLRLERAGRELVFPVYQMLAARTILAPGALPAFELDLVADAREDTQIVKAIEAGLAKHGIKFRADREKFVAVSRPEEIDRVTPEVWELAARMKLEGEILPAGTINFPDTDLIQVAAILQELVQRTVLLPTALASISPPIKARNSVVLSRTEVAYMILGTLAMNGLSAILEGEDFLVICWTDEKDQVAKLLAAKRTSQVAAAGDPNQIMKPMNLRLQWAQPPQLAALYAELSGQPVAVDPSVPKNRLNFVGHKALTRQTALRGLDLVLALNGMALEPNQPEPGLKLVRWAPH